MRYIITLSYDGSAFCGWQSQPSSPSVQSTLEDALCRLLRLPVSVTGAGRTDTGVNAIGYVAHFDVSGPVDTEVLGYKLNAILPPSVVVHSIDPAGGDFHARFGATRREYTYFLHRNKDPFAGKFSYLCGFDLDFGAMNRAAAHLVGTHDFSCFEKSGSDVKTSICTVSEAFWQPYTPQHVSLMGMQPAAGAPQHDIHGTSENPQDDVYWYFRISADRFLRNMVRAIVGTLLDVGRGKRSVEDFARLILPPSEEHTPRRSEAGESVPGYALFLSGIRY